MLKTFWHRYHCHDVKSEHVGGGTGVIKEFCQKNEEKRESMHGCHLLKAQEYCM